MNFQLFESHGWLEAKGKRRSVTRIAVANAEETARHNTQFSGRQATRLNNN